MTPYQLHKLVNEMLKEEGLATIPPQMIYNYCSKKLIKGVTKVDGKLHIPMEECERWTKKYVAKKKERITS